jgi:hypothetical protein
MRAQGTVGAGVASIAGVEVGVAFGSGLGETGGPIDPFGSTPDSPSPKYTLFPEIQRMPFG